MDIQIVDQGYWFNANHFDFITQDGIMDSSFQPAIRLYTITNIDVIPVCRRQGIGKALLRAALLHAEELDARNIIAAITTRECFDAMSTVFGDSVMADQVGDYTTDDMRFPSYRTQAFLKHQL